MEKSAAAAAAGVVLERLSLKDSDMERAVEDDLRHRRLQGRPARNRVITHPS